MMTTETTATAGQRERSLSLRGVGAAVLSLLLVLESAPPVLAQRRRADPEANPQFQQDIQNQEGGGQPLEGGGIPGQAPPGELPQEQPPGRPQTQPQYPSTRSTVQGVQIGASPTAPAAPPAPTNPLETRVTVRVKEAPLATFLDTISAQAKVNFILTEGMESKKITAFLQNVTVREALQILLEIKGLTYQQVGRSTTYIVSPRDKKVPVRITRIYTLNFISLTAVNTSGSGAKGQGQASPSQASAPSPGGSSGQGGPPAGGGGGGGRIGGGGGQGQQGGSSDVGIIGILESVVSGNGKVAVDPRTNSLIVTDIPEVFPQVEQIIAELDKKAPQVMIEAQIVEINSDRAQDLGIEWGGSKGELASFQGGQRDTTFPLDLPNNLGHTHFFNPITSVVSGLGSSGGSGSGGQQPGGSTTQLINGSILKTSVLDLTQLTVVLRALVTRTEARFLGKPKILTINNQLATIRITQKQAVNLGTTQSSGGSLTTQTVEPKREDTGLTLNVTPQVNKEGFITLLIEPSFTNVQASEIGSTSNPVFDPVTRTAISLVRVKNGQTLVLGGLLSSRETKLVRKVPFLGYIPLIGWLFTSISNRRDNTDLVIFITPTIVND
ncbi:MAG: hypothetical protein HY078_00130 [Elusimicrobia bacterium]|nr:hypothetical protein [Elusimicrobiota bacterium]